MYPASRHPGPPPGQPGQVKFTVAENCDRIKEEFSFLQAQYHSLKLELEKLATEKTEMQRHYVMYYEMSYGLNVEMHKQTEIAKRLNAIIAQILPFLSAEHQQQVAAAVDRAKQVTMTELNAIIGQQMHSQQMPPHPHGHPPPFMPHAAAMAAAAGLGQTPGMPPASAAGLLALSASLSGGGVPPHLPPVSVAGVGGPPGSSSSTPAGVGKDSHGRPDEVKRSSSAHSADDRHRNSFSPHIDGRDHDRHRSRSPVDNDSKGNKKRRENNNNNNNNNNDKNNDHASEDERSDADLVVDVANEVGIFIRVSYLRSTFIFFSLSLLSLLSLGSNFTSKWRRNFSSREWKFYQKGSTSSQSIRLLIQQQYPCLEAEQRSSRE